MANTQYLLARDTVMGAEGSAFLTDEDGKQHLLFMLKNINTSADIQSEDMKVVGYMTTLQNARAIQNFTAEDVEVLPGDDVDSIVVNVAIQAVDSVEKIYMTVTVS